jgi:Ca2+-binding RTX toxin-like protein
MNGATPDYTDESGGDDNNAVIDLAGGRIRIKDVSASSMDANLPCTEDAGDTVSCPLEGVSLITVSLGNGNDRMTILAPLAVSVGGGVGNDTISSGPMADSLRGGGGFDNITGGGGNDTIVGDDPLGQFQQSPGGDILDGGLGDDNVSGEAGIDQVAGGDGNDQVSGGEGDDTETGGNGNDNMESTQGERGGNDLIDGGAGDDTMQGGNGSNGADKMLGGPGTDKAVFSERTAPLVLTLDNVANDGEPGEADDVEMDVEDVDGGQAGDTIVGSAAANKLNGAAGNDNLDGGGGGDNLVGGDGIDLANFALRARGVVVKLDGQANDGESGEGDNVDTENATGGSGDDDLEGNAQDNGFAGGAGADDLQGEAGNDSLGGGDGNDDARGGDGNDAMDGGAGENYLDGGTGGDAFAAGTSGDVFRSRDGIADSLVCSGNDFVVADSNDAVTGCGRVDLDNASHAPKLASSAVVRPVGGSLPDMSPLGISRLVPLRDTINLPFGSVLDAAAGDVKITSSGGSGKAKSSATVLGKTASATISDGLFQIKQVKAKVAKTDLVLKGGNFDSCKASSSRTRAHAAASKKTVRRLFGKGKGRFRTRGRFSAATVRGTSWGVRDRCDGTLTTVTKGRVAVFDFARKKTIFVRSGHTYLARATRAALKK